MIKLELAAVLLAASLGLCAASYVAGVRHERAAGELREQKAQVEMMRRAETLSRDLFQKETSLVILQANLDREASADPAAARISLGADSVRRLNRAGTP